MGAPFAGGEVHGPAITDVAEKVSWVEKFVGLGQAQAAAAALATSPYPPRIENEELPEGPAVAGVTGRSPESPFCNSRPASPGSPLVTAPMPLLKTLVARSISMTDSQQLASPAGGSLRDQTARMSLHVGVLQYTPSLEPFPLLDDPARWVLTPVPPCVSCDHGWCL